MKKHFLTVVYAIDDKPETVEAILAQRPWQAVAHTDALKDLDATIDGYDAARLEIATHKKHAAIAAKTLETYKQSGMDFAARVHALERTADKLREENAALQQRDDDWHKEHSNALVEIAILKAAKADARHDTDDLMARDESQRLRIAELEAQLAAIGAGGVEPLRKRECLHQICETAAPASDGAYPKLHERAAFEEWIKKDGGDLRMFGSGQNTHYCNSAVNNALGGWKASAARVATTASAPVVLPEPDVFAKVSHKGAAKWDVEFTWPVGKFEEDGGHKLYTEQQVRAMLATVGQALEASPIDADAQRDADLYRWLRKSPNPACDIKLAEHFCCGRGEDFDAKIDAASAAQGGV